MDDIQFKTLTENQPKVEVRPVGGGYVVSVSVTTEIYTEGQADALALCEIMRKEALNR